MKHALLSPLVAFVVSAVPAGAQEGSRPVREDAAHEPVRRTEEVLVESASKVETTLVNAPATMSVVTSETLEASPARNYADLLRAVPGMNVIQMSARDMNLTTRQGTSTLNNSQLVLVDGRSVYLDFFGLVLWDFVPSPGSNEIKQIEVVRGPASVVWGANALTGVINVITKTSREDPGLGVTIGAGLFGRGGGSREAEGPGQEWRGSFSYAGAFDETWSYRLGAGYFTSDPHSRPVGKVPLDCHPFGVVPCRDAPGNAVPGGIPVGGATYPRETSGAGNFVNSGTSQPKLDLRVDQRVGTGSVTYQAGYAGTDGVIHTGIGPFEIQSGSSLAYGRASCTRGALRLAAFANFVDVKAPNLLLTDPLTLQPVVLGFQTRSYDVEVGHSRVLGGRHLLTYGGNLRRNEFAITLAPGAEDRTEAGAYVQEEFFVDRFRFASGVRADRFGNLDRWAFSPRLSAMFKPTESQSIRASYNRAFRSPSVVNNFLDQNIFSPETVDLRGLGVAVPALAPLIPQEPFFLVLNTFGNPDLIEEHVDALELAYTAVLGGRTTLGVALYQNDTGDNTNFTSLLPSKENPQGLPGLEYYSVGNPARGVGATSGGAFTLSPVLMSALSALPAPLGPVRLPYRVATYLNLGPIRNRGVELSIEHRFSSHWSAFANSSWQAEPRILEPDPSRIRFPAIEVGLPPKVRFNAGLRYDGARSLGSVNVSSTASAFWNDVLTEPYWGTTSGYTLLGATAGVKLAGGNVSLSLRGTNLLNTRVQPHIYGDVLRRSLMAEVRLLSK